MSCNLQHKFTEKELALDDTPLVLDDFRNHPVLPVDLYGGCREEQTHEKVSK